MNLYKNKILWVFFCFCVLLVFSVLPVDRALAAIIVDHNCIDLSKVPQVWIEAAKNNLRVSYGHTSHGSQPISGFEALRDYNTLYQFNTNGAVTAGVLSIADYTPSGDLGNPDRTTWAALTRDYLNNAGQDRNVVVWSWCGQVSWATAAEIDTYLNLMSGLESNFPGVKFVYMTGHLDGTGTSGNLNQRNQQIRAYCLSNNKILFDFADIESYDPGGLTNYMSLGSDDGCAWASDWVSANPNSPLISIAARVNGCAHSHELNCALKGLAFWWLMARLSGWDGTPDPTHTISGIITIEGPGAPLQGVALNGLPGNPLSGTTGYYSAQVNEGWTGVVTPVLTGYAFVPEHRDYAGGITSDQPDQNYTAARRASAAPSGGGGGGGDVCFIGTVRFSAGVGLLFLALTMIGVVFAGKRVKFEE